MAGDQFKIFVEQLRLGNTEEIEESLSPDFLEVAEKELSFSKPVMVKGQVYLADHTLILHFDISTIAVMPCAICNQAVNVGIEIKGFYHAVPLVDIKGAVYDFREILREAILLEVPLLTECHQGKCPQRKSLEKYFKKEVPPGIKEQEEGYRPFANLDFDSGEK